MLFCVCRLIGCVQFCTCCVNIAHIFLCIVTFLVIFFRVFSESPCHHHEHHHLQSLCLVCMRACEVCDYYCVWSVLLYSRTVFWMFLRLFGNSRPKWSEQVFWYLFAASTHIVVLYFGYFLRGCSVTVSWVSKSFGTFSWPVCIVVLYFGFFFGCYKQS